MFHTIRIDDTNIKAKALLEYLKTLDFVKVSETDIPAWQKTQLDAALDEHQSGNANYTEWEEVKQKLFAKYKVK